MKVLLGVSQMDLTCKHTVQIKHVVCIVLYGVLLQANGLALNYAMNK